MDTEKTNIESVVVETPIGPTGIDMAGIGPGYTAISRGKDNMGSHEVSYVNDDRLRQTAPGVTYSCRYDNDALETTMVKALVNHERSQYAFGEGPSRRELFAKYSAKIKGNYHVTESKTVEFPAIKNSVLQGLYSIGNGI